MGIESAASAESCLRLIRFKEPASVRSSECRGALGEKIRDGEAVGSKGGKVHWCSWNTTPNGSRVIVI